jgi:hypothetical protein
VEEGGGEKEGRSFYKRKRSGQLRYAHATVRFH